MPWKKIKEVVGLGKGGALRAAIDAMLPAGSSGQDPTTSVKFTIAVVSLSAKLAKADGVASDVEARAFELLFRAHPDETANIRRVYDLAKRDVAGFESYADQLSDLLADVPQTRRDVLESLFAIAVADGIFHGCEENYLIEVARRFSIGEPEYRSIRVLFVSDPDDPYLILGLAPDVDDATLARRHKELVRQHHPDSLMARNAPTELVLAADRKLALINAAFDRIRKERGR